MKQQFICIRDLQSTGWAVGYYGTLKQWRGKAMEWAYMDDNYSLENMLKTYKIKNNELIDYISEYWNIEIVEYNKEQDYGLDPEDYCELDEY